MNVDSIIMQEVVNTFSSRTVCLTGLISTFFSKLPKLFVFIAAKKCIENSSSVLNPLQEVVRKIFTRLLYTTESFILAHPSKKDYFYATKFTENMCSLEQNGLLPVIVHVETDRITVEYIPRLHNAAIDRIKALAEEAYHKYKKALEKKKILYESASLTLKKDMRYFPCTASALYPSKNYVKLGKMITSHFEISKLVSTSNVLGILLDGVPGLGKTKFADILLTEYQNPQLKLRNR